MTLDEFAGLARIPTPAEFIAFARGQGFGFKVNGVKAALVADPKDPLAVALARMLGREPYRTNVLRALAEADNPANVERPVEPAPAPEPPPAPTRAELIDAVFARRDGRKVYGYDPLTGRGGELASPAAVPAQVGRLCVEGESQWTLLPTT